jgi:serine/threonine protein kinase/Tfp pilus assembly protein PilF
VTNDRAGDVAAATSCEFANGQKVFGRFTLVKILGRGGMGIVWLARDEELERNVALKFLPNLMIQDHAGLDQLKRETKRCLELTHPHIVRIHDFVHDGRSGCISMEYIDGETLSNLRAEKEQKVFEPDEIAIWTSQLCDALDYAHNRAKAIHRDLKPANLMVNQQGDLKVSDFGIARSLGDSVSRLTMEQGRSGTLVYMSPQQLGGERATHLDDIYSLGASIYELLTSKPPFYSGNIDRQIRERVAPSMTERRKELDIEPALVPQVWEDAVAACLAKDPSRRPQSAAEVAQRLQLAPGPARTRRAPGKSSNRKVLLVGGIAALSILAFAGFYLGVLNRQAKPVSQTAAIPEKSIAVLPFNNLSDDPQNSFFADGVQDEILTDLAKIADLKVISRTSVAQYKTDAKRNLREIAKALGVAHIVEGSVQRTRDRVRVSAQLIDATTDTHLWAEHYDRNIADMFALESELAEKIVSKLKARLSPEEKSAIEEQPTHDLFAYDLYTRAKVLEEAVIFDVRVDQALLEAARLLEQAVARDPSFFEAHCLLASVYDQLYFFGIDQTPARLALAEATVQTVFRLRPEAGEAHLAAARHFYWGYRDYDRARSELNIAAHALPNDPLVFEILGYIDRRQGRWEESTRQLQHALELDPLNLSILRAISFSYERLRRFSEAAAMLDRALGFAPKDIGTRINRGVIDLWWRADPKPLHSAIEAILRENPKAAESVADQRLHLALCERDRDEARKALTSLSTHGYYDNGFPYPHGFCEGLVALLFDDQAAARDALTRARNEVDKIVSQEPTRAEALSVLGLIEALLGHKEQAIRDGRRALELLPLTADSINGEILIEHLAIIYAWTGEKDLAFSQLTIAARVPGDLNYGELRLYPGWDPLRNDPRFEEIVTALAPQ